MDGHGQTTVGDKTGKRKGVPRCLYRLPESHRYGRRNHRHERPIARRGRRTTRRDGHGGCWQPADRRARKSGSARGGRVRRGRARCGLRGLSHRDRDGRLAPRLGHRDGPERRRGRPHRSTDRRPRRLRSLRFTVRGSYSVESSCALCIDWFCSAAAVFWIERIVLAVAITEFISACWLAPSG